MKDGKRVVLYIDDDDDALFAIRTILEANGYIMAGAASAEEGLRIYKELNPDFVIVDLMMEEVDSGASFAKELKALGTRFPSTCSARWATTSVRARTPWLSAWMACSRSRSRPRRSWAS